MRIETRGRRCSGSRARGLGVSHQAPYKHYPSRDDLLAEVVRRCFEGFAAALNGRERSDDPVQDLRSLGRCYRVYALQHPLEYRLMFATQWPGGTAHPDLLRDARLSFDVLRSALTPLFRATASAQQIDLHAMFVWSTVHGLATILQSRVMEQLDLGEAAMSSAVEHVMDMSELALQAAAINEGQAGIESCVGSSIAILSLIESARSDPARRSISSTICRLAANRAGRSVACRSNSRNFSAATGSRRANMRSQMSNRNMRVVASERLPSKASA
jgi:AcrR family transcriptional regulator